MTDNMVIPRVTYGGPELHGEGPVDFNQHRNALYSPLRKNLLDVTDQLSTNPMATAPWTDDEAVHVAAPTVESTQQ